MKLNKHQIEQVCKKLSQTLRQHTQSQQSCGVYPTINEELIRFSFLAKGNHNSNYLLETGKNKYILRVEDNQQFKNLKKEFKFLKLANPGLGPKVMLFDNSHKAIPRDYLIEEFIEGKHPSEENPSNDFIVQMAEWFKGLHKATKNSSKPYLLTKEVKPYYKNYLKYKDNIEDEELNEKLSGYIANALKLLKKNNTVFAERKTVSLLHNDTSSGNIFYKPGYIRLIDWEFVGYGLPERELAYFLDSYRLTKEQQKLFLRRYGYPNTEKANTRLRMAYIILLFSSIGYSLWQLNILNKNKSLKKDKAERMKRLMRDISLLKKKVNER